MVASVWTRHFCIVVRADLAAQANIAANHASWDPGGAGDQTFTVPLSASGSLPATAYWCSTAATNAIASAIATRLLARGATAQEVTPIVFGQTPASNRFAVFDMDGTGWTPDAVLTACGLQRIASAP